MKIVLATLLAAAMLAVMGLTAFIWSGIFNVAANDPHWSVTYWIMEKTRMYSIQRHAAGITPPAGYDKPARVVGAVGHFSEHCANCHGGPGIPRGEVAEGMYPQPPDLTNVAGRYTPGELFWILRNGIKMSGMPSMASDGDDMLWATVAFLRKLPGMSDEDYNDLWMESQAQGARGGMGMDHGSMRMDPMDHGAKAGGSTPGEGHGTGDPAREPDPAPLAPSRDIAPRPTAK